MFNSKNNSSRSSETAAELAKEEVSACRIFPPQMLRTCTLFFLRQVHERILPRATGLGHPQILVQLYEGLVEVRLGMLVSEISYEQCCIVHGKGIIDLEEGPK